MKAEKNKNLKKSFRLLKNPFALIFYIIMIFYVLSMIVPSLWMLITTFKDRLAFRFNRFGLPDEFSFENYANVFIKMYVPVTSNTGVSNVYMHSLFINSLVYSVFNVAASLFVQILVSYGCGQYKSAVGKVLFAFALVIMILPIVGALPSKLIIYKTLGLYDNLIGIIFAHAGWGGSTFLILYASFKSLGNEYREAASIDGASHLRIMFLIMVPMVWTTILALFILGFIGAWNDYMTPMIFLPSMPTLAYGLFQFRYSSDSIVSAIPMQITACVVVMFPILILFVIFKNKIMGNLTLGGLKG